MRIELWTIGKTDEAYLRDGISKYEKRLARYIPFSILELPDVRQRGNTPADILRKQEGERVQDRLQDGDLLVLLDENGRSFRSEEFARFLDKLQHQTARRIVFLIGGAYGVDPQVKARAQYEVSLSPMTFSHQMVRLFFVEQLYRAMTILRNEPYHNP